MGPKRKPRTTKGGRGSKAVAQLTVEEQLLRDQCDLLLKDFDKEASSLVSQSLREVKTVSDCINKLYKLELMKLSQDVKKMKWDEYCEQGVDSDLDPLALAKEVEAAVEDSMAAQVDRQVSAIKSTVKKGKKKKAQENLAESVTRTSSRNRTTSRALADSTNLETPSLSRRGGRGEAVTATPVNSALPPGMGGKTPMITPKFDTRSLCRTVTRVARVDEVLVSLSGSPVAPQVGERTKAAKVMKENNASIPLGGGETLNLPLGADGAVNMVDLDNEQAARLEELHRNLGNMLRLRDQGLQAE